MRALSARATSGSVDGPDVVAAGVAAVAGADCSALAVDGVFARAFSAPLHAMARSATAMMRISMVIE
jgi:hypothetical protein